MLVAGVDIWKLYIIFREKESLRRERERFEREKAELLGMQREQQRLERQKLEQEMEELRRAKMKWVKGSLL